MRKVIGASISFLLVLFIIFFMFFLPKNQNNGGDTLDPFYELTKNQPLFYSPSVNPEELRESLGWLEKEENELRRALIEKNESRKNDSKGNSSNETFEKIASAYYSELAADPELTFLHPLPFLKLIPEIIKTTNLYLENKDRGTAAELLKLYERAAGYYKKSAEDQLYLLKKIHSADSKAIELHFVGLAASSNLGILIKDFELINENADLLLKEVQSRRKCLEEKICPVVKEKRGTKWSDYFRKPPLSLIISLRKRKIPDDLLDTINRGIEKSGPYLVNTICHGNSDSEEKPARYLYLMIAKGKFFTPKRIDESYYKDLAKEKDQYAEKLIEQGIEYDFQQDGVDYLCPDLTYWTDLSYLASGDKLTYLPKMINTISEDLSTTRIYQKLYPTPTSPIWLMAFQSDYSLLYFPFSENNWFVGKQLILTEPRAQKTNFYLVYSELKKFFDKEQTKTFHFDSTNFRNKVVEEMEK